MVKKCFISLLIVSLVSCVSYRIANEKVITTYMDNGNVKYYIRPSKLTSDEKADAYAMLDITYQKRNRAYVSPGFVNFTLQVSTSAFVRSAQFILPEEQVISLTDISTLDRNAVKGFIRVSTTVAQESMALLLERLQATEAVLEVVMDDDAVYRFTVSQELTDKLAEAFEK